MHQSVGFRRIFATPNQAGFDNHGVYAQGTYKLTDSLYLTGGIRWTFDKIAGLNEGGSHYASPHEHPFPLRSVSPAFRARLLTAALAIIAGGAIRKVIVDPAGSASSLPWLYARSDERHRARLVKCSARWPAFLRHRLETAVLRHAPGRALRRGGTPRIVRSGPGTFR